MVVDSVCPRPDMLADYVRFRTLDTISLEKQKARFSEVLGYYDCEYPCNGNSKNAVVVNNFVGGLMKFPQVPAESSNKHSFSNCK